MGGDDVQDSKLTPAARVLDIPVWGHPLTELLDHAFQRIAAGRKTLFTTVNAHSFIVAQDNPAFLRHFIEADVVLPDGMLAVLAARWSGGRVVERVAGPDFFEAFLRRASSARVSVFFLGTTKATLQRMQERCRRELPDLHIAGAVEPPFGDFDSETDAALIRRVNDSGASALFVAMTAPKQELWLSRNGSALSATFAMGVGAAFDFFAGTRRRAPRLLGQNGGEWLYRLVREPRRLWRRNLDSLAFILEFSRRAVTSRLRGGR